MRISRWLVLVLLVGVALGCPSEDESEGDDQAQWEEIDDEDLWPVLFAEVRCSAAWDCPQSHRDTADQLVEEWFGLPAVRRFESNEECIEITTELALEQFGIALSPRMKTSLEEGRIEVDRSRIEDCREALYARSCAGISVDSLTVDICAEEVGLFKSTREEGEPCLFHDIECVGPLKCQSVDGQCYGYCAAPEEGSSTKAQGEECEVNADCEEGLVCHGESANPISGEGDQSCEPLAGEGEACERISDCMPDLVCLEATCVPWVMGAEGDNCDASSPQLCGAGTRCEESNSDAQCTSVGKVGDSCSSSVDCLHNLYCRSDETCQAVAASGEPCETHSGCARGYYCESDSELCEAQLGQGESCTSSEQCVGFCELPQFGITGIDEQNYNESGQCESEGFIPSPCDVPEP